MAQTPEGPTAPVQAPDEVPRPLMEELPSGIVFHPNAFILLEYYLIPMACGGVIEEPYEGCIADGVDVHALRPEALPFPDRNSDEYGKSWSYFFTTRPAGAGGIGAEGGGGGGGDEVVDDVREVAAGGCWRGYGDGDKEYVDQSDGEVYAFRRRFAFHEAGDRGKKTAWRMKEYRLKETAPRFRGVAFHPSGKGLVIWKVYNEVVPEEEPPVDYYGIGMKDVDDDEVEEIGAVVITVGDAAAPAP